ncbi:M23 family metallopeptidase [Naasia lichenicola]|nr:M23 family metallopeptidase [Naasia lichenicola]
MALVTSVPANALLSSADLSSNRLGTLSPTADQVLAASGGQSEVVSRDGYGSDAAPPSVVWPVAKHTVSDGFGYRVSPCSGCSTMHQGTDFTGGYGADIVAIADGTVKTVIEQSGGLGVHVIIEHQIDGEMYTSIYGHMQFGSVGVVEGQTVKAGDFVGLLGNTGDSTGPHLHFELHPGGGAAVDAFKWLTANVS